jgi:hypothetical protein
LRTGGRREGRDDDGGDDSDDDNAGAEDGDGGAAIAAAAAVDLAPSPPPRRAKLSPRPPLPPARRTTALPPPLQGPSPFASAGLIPSVSYSSNRADVDVRELAALLRTAAAHERLAAAPAPWPRSVRGSVPPLAPHWFDADERGQWVDAG